MAPRRFGPCQDFLSKASSSPSRSRRISGVADKITPRTIIQRTATRSPPPLGDLFAHSGGLRPVGVMLEEIFQVGRGGHGIAPAQVNLHQEELRVGKMSRVDLASLDEV